MPPFYIEGWNALTDDGKRKRVQGLVNDLDGDFAPDPLIRIWLLEQAGVMVP